MSRNETKQRIKKEAQLILVQTALGSSVKITKKAACDLLDNAARRNVTAKVEFTEIGNGKFLVTIDA